MSRYSYIVLDSNPDYLLERDVIASMFSDFKHVGSADTISSGVDLVLEKTPHLIFLNIDQAADSDGLSLSFIAELHRYISILPTIVILSARKEKAYDAIKYGAFDFLTLPLTTPDLRKCFARYIRSFGHTVDNARAVSDETKASENTSVELIDEDLNTDNLNLVDKKPLVICVKSYGDYRFINAADICYLQADNNSTDLHLQNGEMITAFKTLKHFENVLDQPFVRIHNSYIVNTEYISRIHTGNSVCFLKNSTIKLPFSKSYKESIEQILKTMSMGNYLET